MGRQPCCDKVGLKKGPWTAEEDQKLVSFLLGNGQCCWRAVPKLAGLLRCGKSCRLRWINYLRPDLRRGNFTDDEEETVIKLHALLGNKWSKIAACLPGRTDNEIKNVWNTHLKKKASQREQKPATDENNGEAADGDSDAPLPSLSSGYSSTTISNGDHDAGEQCGTSNEPHMTDVPSPLELEPDIDILDMLVDEAKEMPPMPTTSSCSSSSLVTCAGGGGVEEMLELPEIDMDMDIWSIIDDDFARIQGDATVPCTTDANQEEEGKEWSLEDLEKELGLWGPTEEFQALVGPPDQIGYPAPPYETEGEPVSSCLQSRSDQQPSNSE